MFVRLSLTIKGYLLTYSARVRIRVRVSASLDPHSKF